MYYFDAHCHLTDMTYENLRDMALANTRGIVTPVQIPLRHPISADGLIDIWKMHLEEFIPRSKQQLIDVYAMIGMSMVCTPAGEVDRLLGEMEKLLKLPEVVAVGEVGFELNSPTNNDEAYQKYLYECQLDVVKAAGKTLDIHTSFAPERKIKYTDLSLKLAAEHGLDMKKVVVDHCTADNIEMALDAGAYAAITVQPWRGITPEIAAELIMKYNSDRVFVDSDCCADSPSDPLSVAKTAYALELMGASRSLIDGACALNCKRAYGIKD